MADPAPALAEARVLEALLNERRGWKRNPGRHGSAALIAIGNIAVNLGLLGKMRVAVMQEAAEAMDKEPA